jgi:hypothetical protein
MSEPVYKIRKHTDAQEEVDFEEEEREKQCKKPRGSDISHQQSSFPNDNENEVTRNKRIRKN